MTPRRENHSHTVPGGRGFWWTERLWEASADLPVEDVPIDSIAEFDTDCWFRGVAPSWSRGPGWGVRSSPNGSVS